MDKITRKLISFTAGVLLWLTAAVPVYSFEVEGLPGATWGQVTHSVSGITGSGSMGWVRQGIDWFVLPGDIVFDTYAEYRFRQRSDEKLYYNTHGPVVGVEFRKDFLTVGAEYYRERFSELGETSRNKEVYATWYYDWQLGGERLKELLNVQAFPGSTWGRLYHDTDGITGSGGIGWINQGIDWFTIPGDIVVNTYAEYRYRGRSKQELYYDAQGPAVGLEFRKSYFRLGVSYYWERFPELGERSNTAEYYFNWYYDWDLKD